MAQFDAAVTHLLTLLDTATDFAVVAHEFLDLCENDAFLQSGKSVQVPAFLKIVLQTGLQTLGRKYGETRAVIHVSSYDLYHGCLISNGQMGFFLYFRRNDKGLICLNNNDNQLFARITAMVVKDPRDATLN